MHAFIIYLFKVSCWVAIWWLLYRYFLRKETFFTFNRIYLMSGLVTSLIIPLLKITYPVEIVINQSTTSSVVENFQASVGNPVDIYFMLFYLYVFCGMLLIIRQLFLLLKLNRRLRSGGFTNVNNYRLVDSPDVQIPFSFFNCIFFNSRKTSEHEHQLIFAHERYHINQRHWIDLAIMECISIFLWFNPFVWLYRRSVQENHEYLADKAVIQSGYSPVYYRAALINQSMYSPVFPFVNSFAHYKFKRISMMKKENSNPLKKLAVLLLVPAMGFFLWAFAEPDYRITTIGQQPEYDYSTVNVPETVENVNVNDAVETVGTVRIVKAVKKVEAEAPVVLQNDTLRKVVEEVVVIGYGTQKKSSDSSTTDKNQEPVKVIGYGTRSSGSSPLIIIDGEEPSPTSLKNLVPEQIESISVLKDGSATSVYGEKGKNGVILITTKEKDQTPVVTVNEKNQPFDVSIRGTNFLNSSTPLYIIDEIESTENALKELNPNDIESITVLKNERATSVYGEKAKNGVILITTKKNKETSEKSAVDISG